MILSRAGFALHADDLSVNVAGNMPSPRSFPGSEYPGTSVTLGGGPYTVHADRDRTLNGRTHITGYQFQEVTVQVQFTQVTIDAFIQGQKYMMPVRRSWNLVRLQHLASDQPPRSRSIC